MFAADVGDGKIEGVGQLAADPIQRIQPRTAAVVLTPHLPDHHFGVGVEPAPPVRRLRTAVEVPRVSPQNPSFQQRGFSRRFPYRYCLIVGCSRANRQEQLTLKGSQ